MKGPTSIRKFWALCVLAASLALPMSGQAGGHHHSSGSVSIGYGGYGYPGGYYAPVRHGYGHRHHGYYAPHCPPTYYRPYTRVYYAPRYYAPSYYGYGGSGWDINLNYHFSDR